MLPTLRHLTYLLLTKQVSLTIYCLTTYCFLSYLSRSLLICQSYIDNQNNSPYTHTSHSPCLDPPINIDSNTGSVTFDGVYNYPPDTSVTSYYEYSPCPFNPALANATDSVTEVTAGGPQSAPAITVTDLPAGTW
jgi:hypothetical protein